ncbi:DUF1059 domain-containing protein [Caldiplasma sukawensis]
MAKYTFRCADIGQNCGFEASGKSVDELMPKIKEHAAKEHNITEVNDELAKKINGAIKKKMF